MPSRFDFGEVPRRWFARGLIVLLVLAMVLSATTATLAYTPPQLERGTVTRQANGSTIIAVQGFHWKGKGNHKKPARLVSAGPDGHIQWVYSGSKRGANWFYSVDPLPNGNILAVNTIREDGRGKTLVYELNPKTKQRVWQVKLNMTDTHDADLINGHELIVANMRNWDAKNETSNDRLVIYDLSGVMNGTEDNVHKDDIVWQWYFKNHYPPTMDGGMKPDWTHVNDVDKIGPGKYMASVRNFDQVIVVDRKTKNITLQLGKDDHHDILNEQHNPTYLQTKDGKPAILVADSDNNRVVEYTCVKRVDGKCDWNLTWSMGKGQLSWPRDANRLPNGDTLITDSRNHRVLEVTPKGNVVWEVYAPWAPFNAERVSAGNDGVRSPTMSDLNVSGSYEMHGSANLTAGTGSNDVTFPEWLQRYVVPLPLIGGPANGLATAWASGAQWIKPVWMAPWSFVYVVFVAVLLLLWGLAEAIYQRRRIVGGVRGLAER